MFIDAGVILEVFGLPPFCGLKYVDGEKRFQKEESPEGVDDGCIGVCGVGGLVKGDLLDGGEANRSGGVRPVG